jgi:hypothetical protein
VTVHPVEHTSTDPTPTTSDGEGDHDRMAHIVPKHELTRALVDGVEVTALCGKRWVPHRDPERYPVCQTCAELLAALRSGP